ncbi:MAG TPA: hypothetical protein VGG56_11215 [Terracidiphilus sp.]|jgi:hypothetical protein
MRRWILLGLLLAITLHCGAEKRVTVAELEQTVTVAAAARKPDAEIVRQLNSMELTERLSEATLDRLSAHVKMSPQVALALELLADESAFRDLPASELPVVAAPDQAAQLQMFDRAARYVAGTLQRLPDFLATRETNRFDDSPQAVKKGGWPVRAGLHQVDRSSREVSVREERESQSTSKGSAQLQANSGLTTWGEFGSVLGIILSDSMNGTVRWDHWEQTSAGMAAVFHYSVPKAASHFEVISPVQRPPSIEAFATPRDGSRASSIGARPNTNSAGNSVMHDRRAYEGSLWLDPATGTILRLTIEADSKSSATFQRAAMLVQYGEVEIGGAKFTCPVRSVALSRTVIGAEASTGNTPSEWLNETRFTGYHRFAATTRILTGPPTQ